MMPKDKHILVVDDHVEVANLCKRALLAEGYQVTVARNGIEALQLIEKEKPDLAIIDILMPGIDGIELCKSLRAMPGLADLPILFLTGKHDIADKAVAFSVGADDYLTKPFDVRELLMRVRALLRRASPIWAKSQPRELVVGNLRLDCRSFCLSTPEKTVLLTPVEFELLHYMMSHPGQVFSSERLLREVWGYPPGTGSSEVVRAHIKNIRDKIEPNSSQPRYIRTVGRHGYSLS
ncbi:MAG: response regulator transcription factor [Anaerolineae bacterium]